MPTPTEEKEKQPIVVSYSWEISPSAQAKDRLKFITQRWLNEDTLRVILPYMALMPDMIHTSPISLRIVEWFCTNYSKVYEPKMHESYIRERNIWKRRMFDIFAREGDEDRPHIIYLHYADDKYKTTIAQIQYLLWAHRTGVLDYCVEHEEAIQKHMSEILTQSGDSKRIAKQLGIKRKRTTLTHVQATQNVRLYNVTTKLQLNI